jgi:hypothetical protein
MSPLDLLRRYDRYELADNRMTLYASGFGLGSVHYWDGSWDNDEDEIPYQSREVFENRDGELEVLLESGSVDVLHKDRHLWQPHRITTRFVGSHSTVWEESKAIHQDVAVSVMRVMGGGLKARRVTLRHRIASTPHLEIKTALRGAHLFSRQGRYAGIHRFIGFSGQAKTRLIEDGQDASLEIELQIPHESTRELAFIVAAGENKTETQKRYRAALQAPHAFLEGAHERWQEYFARHVPVFDCDSEKWKKLYYFSCYVLRANLYDFKKGAIQNPYSCPSKWRLMPSWFWDPCFHGFSEKWLRDYPAPLSTFRNHIAAQEKSGCLPMTLDCHGDTWKRLAGTDYICQQFVHPMTVWDCYLVHGDKSTLSAILEPLARHDRFIGRYREVDGLFVPRGGGELADNSSRLVADISARDKISELGRTIQPIDWNTFQYIAERLIGRMAREVGRDDLAKEMEARAVEKLHALRKLWNPSTQLFSDRVMPSGELSNKKIPEALMALLGGYANRAQVKSTVEFLTDPQELWTKYPVPTLPLSDPAFIAEDCYASYWNGRVWPNMNWCYIEALARAGQKSVAKQLLHRTLEMFVSSGEAHCMENYNPLSDERYSPPHSIFNQGWGTVGIDLILRRGLGLQLNAPQNEVSFAALGLPNVKECLLQGAPYGENTLDVSITLMPEPRIKVKTTERAKLATRLHHWLDY